MKLSSEFLSATPPEGCSFRAAQVSYWAVNDSIRLLREEVAEFQCLARMFDTIGNCPLAADNLGTNKCSNCHASGLCFTGYNFLRESK